MSSPLMFPALTTVSGLINAAGHHGLQLSGISDELDQSGLDFLALHARDEHGTPWIVRTPRRPSVAEAAVGEGRVLALVRPRLPVAVPDWRIHTPEMIAYPRLGGTPVITIEAQGPVWHVIDPAAPSPLFLESVGQALAALQAIPIDEARAAGAPWKPVADARGDLAQAMETTREALRPPPALWDRWHRWLDDDGMWPDHEAMTHGDLHPGHLLVDNQGRLTGILDWTEASVTDPAMDLAMFLGCFGNVALEAMLASFIRAGGRLWPRAVEHATERWAASPALGAAWALRHNNEAVLEHARGHMAALSTS
jgi:aminoglycoside phosphotransferase (APT) family kinase protein